MQSSSFRPPMAVPRFVPALAASFVSVASFAVLLAGFDDASPRRWLLPTPAVHEMVAQCDSFKHRAERDACSRQVIAVLLERQRREVLLASR